MKVKFVFHHGSWHAFVRRGLFWWDYIYGSTSKNYDDTVKAAQVFVEQKARETSAYL